MQRTCTNGWKDSKVPEHVSLDEDHLGFPTTSQMVNNVEQVNAVLQEDRQVTGIDIANMLDVSCGFMYSIIHEDLRYYKICDNGCQDILQKNIHRHVWKQACNFCSSIMKKERLSCSMIVTGDKTWLHHCEPASKL